MIHIAHFFPKGLCQIIIFFQIIFYLFIYFLFLSNYILTSSIWLWVLRILNAIVRFLNRMIPFLSLFGMTLYSRFLFKDNYKHPLEMTKSTLGMNDMQFTKPDVDIWILVNMEWEVQRVSDISSDPSSLKNREANPAWQHVDRACALLWRQKI